MTEMWGAINIGTNCFFHLTSSIRSLQKNNTCARSKLKNVTNLRVKADTGQSRKCFQGKMHEAK